VACKKGETYLGLNWTVVPSNKKQEEEAKNKNKEKENQGKFPDKNKNQMNILPPCCIC
jgi:hypothetical protein